MKRGGFCVLVSVTARVQLVGKHSAERYLRGVKYLSVRKGADVNSVFAHISKSNWKSKPKMKKIYKFIMT